MSSNTITTTTSENKIPKFKPVDQNFSRKKKFYTKEEWLNVNEMDIADTYGALTRYLADKNLLILDDCSYIEFCDFVAEKSSRFKDNYD